MFTRDCCTKKIEFKSITSDFLKSDDGWNDDKVDGTLSQIKSKWPCWTDYTAKGMGLDTFLEDICDYKWGL